MLSSTTRNRAQARSRGGIHVSRRIVHATGRPEARERLLKLDRNLAAKLEAVIVSRVVRERNDGLAAQYE
jgi:hypothetical protein